ncbi:glycosyltransferase family protein [Sphingobacterium multivorum]|uniref:CDP-Glycerol:Poly(Glycerophosphate) glycerophosphotransferase n=1 Tax=Sphingobacterium multivorum TaxID=28454 RepID=A0A2X2L3B1_SPHMU|nr:hypothetical protein [Sphingobacterium multivorum]QRQ61203.1 hypothetical protein I6J33_24395 [Sphingobacterium multivorum]SPZ88469.1 Uncharacterised protein [Sphingobacterium multivorum]
MRVFFFKDGINEVIDFLNKHTQESCAFWYAPGLLSYRYLEDYIEVTDIFVQDTIAEDFKRDYPNLSNKIVKTFFGSLSCLNNKNKKICFFASSDTIVSSFVPILNLMDKKDYKLFCRGNEAAQESALLNNINAEVTKTKVSNQRDYSVFITANDWGLLEQKLNSDFLIKGKNTLALQESSIDFNPKFGKMRNCNFPVFQGIASLSNYDVRGRIMAVIGNPRFERLKPSLKVTHNLALVNVNFTYGIFEDVRENWIEDVVTSCYDTSFDYVISQHPRDNADLSSYKVLKSNSSLIHDQLKNSSVLISRFSALLTEAICLGRPAIYYNPHNEKFHYSIVADNQMLFYAKNRDELRRILKHISTRDNTEGEFDSKFLNTQIGAAVEGNASLFILEFLEDFIKFPFLGRKISRWNMIILNLKILKRRLFGKNI